MENSLRVFISYSGDDWTEHVEPLTRHLLANGINAIAANWDLKPGESIANWILNEQIPAAQVVVIVLSKSSVTKPWVREELDHATVRRIEERIKIIPLKIDDCEIPGALRTLKRISVHSPEEWEDKRNELVDAIYSRSAKPPIGSMPRYMIGVPWILPDLSEMESQLLGFALNKAMEEGEARADIRLLEDQLEAVLSPKQIQRSIGRLEARGIVTATKNINGKFMDMTLGRTISEKHCSKVYPEFVNVQRAIGADAARLSPNSLLIQRPPEGVPMFVYQTAVESLANRGWFKAQRNWGGGYLITNASPFIEDWLEEL